MQLDIWELKILELLKADKRAGGSMYQDFLIEYKGEHNDGLGVACWVGGWLWEQKQIRDADPEDKELDKME